MLLNPFVKIGRKEIFDVRMRRRASVSVDLIPNWLFFGLQWVLPYRRYSMDYVDDEAIAEKARAGLWRGAFEKPWEWRRRKR